MGERGDEKDAGRIWAKDIQVDDVLVLSDCGAGRVGYVHHATDLIGPLTSYVHMHIFDLITGQMLYGIVRGEQEWVQLARIPDRYLPDDDEESDGSTDTPAEVGGAGPVPDAENDAPWDAPCEHIDGYGSTVMEGMCFLCGARIFPSASSAQPDEPGKAGEER